MKSDLNILKEEIEQFNKDRDWDQFHSPANLAKSISIEANELLECFQWDEDNYNIEEVKEELADVMNYCIQMSNKLNLDIKEIIEWKLRITAKKYPVEKAKGKSTKYNKLWYINVKNENSFNYFNIVTQERGLICL